MDLSDSAASQHQIDIALFHCSRHAYALDDFSSHASALVDARSPPHASFFHTSANFNATPSLRSILPHSAFTSTRRLYHSIPCKTSDVSPHSASCPFLRPRRSSVLVYSSTLVYLQHILATSSSASPPLLTPPLSFLLHSRVSSAPSSTPSGVICPTTVIYPTAIVVSLSPIFILRAIVYFY
ncbi:hypothetical protein BDD12DRAFT_900804 [Trichophaea hybrida]|nr:hypothetical protein BDD12DRAFT_900804 [Trichophaea hybrida]